jgi:hypothetical protein
MTAEQELLMDNHVWHVIQFVRHRLSRIVLTNRIMTVMDSLTVQILTVMVLSSQIVRVA